MPTTLTGSGVTFNDNSVQTTSALAANAIGTSQIAANAITAAKLGTTENLRLARAWVNFNGTGTPAIRSSYNVSSVTKNGTGDYTVNFATPMADANYSVATNCEAITGTSHVARSPSSFRQPNTASQCYVGVEQGGVSPADRSYISVQIFGN